MMDRRNLITSAAALAACAALPREALADDALVGLPLAAEYGRLAAQAMAYPGIMGRWEMVIVTGDADQRFGFTQLGSGLFEAKRRLAAAQNAFTRVGQSWGIVKDEDNQPIAMVRHRLGATS